MWKSEDNLQGIDSLSPGDWTQVIRLRSKCSATSPPYSHCYSTVSSELLEVLQKPIREPVRWLRGHSTSYWAYTWIQSSGLTQSKGENRLKGLQISQGMFTPCTYTKFKNSMLKIFIYSAEDWTQGLSHTLPLKYTPALKHTHTHTKSL